MRGRVQAIAAAFVPVIGFFVIGLVTLRKGFQEGGLILLAALIPWLFTLESKAILVFVVGLSVEMLIIASALRLTQSWPKTLLIATGISCVFWLMPSAAEVVGQYKLHFDKAYQEMLQAEEPVLLFTMLSQYTLLDLQAAFASATLELLALCLLLARYCQAALYNPGGFRQEFHQLRFSRYQGVLLVAAVLLCTLMGPGWQLWVNVLALPLLIAGAALVHWWVSSKQLGVQTLVMFYVGLILVMPLFVPMLVVIAFTDSIVDLRRYLGRKP
ncbi:hypothetical protein QSV34_08330 [Porticoccus sp. W117]|uniref:hypothetical protein n=1 Tax=Porticoccus sp. W117 TaxID=3054777 RepID=UPI0025937C0D|nr:hypothetical protein [Porticoccus sp. W117]MDM3871360.1 hypothetical protein [Porticoccus sp. W117]